MEPTLIMLILFMSVAGASLGMASGLIPGIHVNTLASLMLIAYPVIGSAISSFSDPVYVPILLASCIISASVVHSFVSYVPSVFTGVPDQDSVMNVLPGHRLLLEGRGMTAARASAIGSLVGGLSAVAAALPLQYLMVNGLGEYLGGITSAVLLMAVAALVLSEGTFEKGSWAAVLIFISGIMGCVCMFMPIPFSGVLFDGDLLLPMLTGLFGIPVLIFSSAGMGIPGQKDDDRYPVTPVSGLKGVVTGSMVGWFPGITATAGAAFTRMFIKEDRPEKFIALVASIGTASAVFALITFSISGKERTGTMVIVSEMIGDGMELIGNGEFMLMLLSVATACTIGYAAAIRSGTLFSKAISKINIKKMNNVIIVFIVILVTLLTGIWGIAVLMISSVIGMIPLSAGTCRVHLSGCLIVPVILIQFGYDVLFLSMF